MTLEGCRLGRRDGISDTVHAYEKIRNKMGETSETLVTGGSF